MKAIILAAGYATRLYPLTLDKAKPLLPVGGKLIIDHIVQKLSELKDIDGIFVVTNNRFYKDFEEWKNTQKLFKKITVVNDGTANEHDRLGAIGDINLVIRQNKLSEDLLIVAGDNLFNFSLVKFADFFKKNGISVAVYKSPYQDELSNYGLVEVDTQSRIRRFTEKPENPESNLVAICLYLFPKNKVGLIHEYINGVNNKDAPGYYLKWLSEKEDVYAFLFETQWHDIGTPESYMRAKTEYEKVLEKSL